MDQKKTIQQALIHSLPIMGSYMFVSMAYGLMMQEAGFGWGWSLLASMTVYTGAFQFVLVAFLSSGASILTIMMTALFMNSRQFFYGLTFVEDFKQMGKRYPYMVYTMTDETYAVNCSLLPAQGEESEQEKHRRFDTMAWVALFSRISWMAGAVAGGMIGQLLPAQLEGIDFCMTALFVTIFIDQWKSRETHIPAVAGLVVGLLLLLLFGEEFFLLPTLILVSGLLLLCEKRIDGEGKCDE